MQYKTYFFFIILLYLLNIKSKGASCINVKIKRVSSHAEKPIKTTLPIITLIIVLLFSPISLAVLYGAPDTAALSAGNARGSGVAPDNDGGADSPSENNDDSSLSESFVESYPASITDSPSFRQTIAVNADENDVSVYPETAAESMFDSSDAPDFDADAYILIDRRTGQTICSKNADMKLYPASTTKIMTAILAIEMGDLDEIMTASVRAVRDIGPDGSNIGIIAGEKMRLDNLLDALLVRSANETANIIAENLCETREDFIALMNKKAKELGAFNTNFTNTSGFHETTHYSTAYDLAKIANYAMNNPHFRKTVAQRNINLAPTNKHASWDRMNTTNSLLTDDTISGFAITGVKTGYHSASGYCVVAAGIDNNDMELLCVVLGVRGTVAGTSAKRFKIAADLLAYGFENYQMRTFIRAGESIGAISVLGGENLDTVDVVSDGTIRQFMPVDQEKWDISRIEYLKSEVPAPVENGDTLGYVEYRNNGGFAGRVNLIASSDIQALKGGVREIPNRGDTGSAKSSVGNTDAADNLTFNPYGNPSIPEENLKTSAGGAGNNVANPDSGSASGGNPDNIFESGRSFLERINFPGALRILLFSFIVFAALVSVLRTINAIRRSNRINKRVKYHGRLDYPPVRGKYRRLKHANARERIKYDAPRARASAARAAGARPSKPRYNYPGERTARNRGRSYSYSN